jgi:nitroreductase/NAD-dependent dihydropyrimidine dehydrogenase PreA subunit
LSADRRTPVSPLLVADPDLCTLCGICSDTCPRGIISVDGELPGVASPGNCMACGHCVAVCPEAALDNALAPLAAQPPLESFPVLDPATAAAFLRSRRSIRTYRQEPVPRETLLQLLEIARFAPSGSNSQGLSYLVVTDRDVLRHVVRLVVEWLAKEVAAGEAWTAPYAGMVEKHRATGTDVILRGAPCLIVATAPRDFRSGHENSRYSLEYVELYATSLGLGTCWAGFFEHCAAAEGSPVPGVLGLPGDTAIVGALMVGYPRYTYQRLVDRDPLRVSWL